MKRFIPLLISISILAGLIYYHKDIVYWCINAKLSFSMSMMLPYSLELAAIVAIVVSINRLFLKNVSHNIRRLVSLAVLLIAGGIAFAMHPIYDGDFNNTYRKIYYSGEYENEFRKGLNMVVLPGCPFCHMRLNEMNKLKELYPALPITVLVVHEDTLALQDYKENSGAGIEVNFLSQDVVRILQIDSYPTIFYKEEVGDKDMKMWDNNGFGSAAWDYVLDEEDL